MGSSKITPDEIVVIKKRDLPYYKDNYSSSATLKEPYLVLIPTTKY